MTVAHPSIEAVRIGLPVAGVAAAIRVLRNLSGPSTGAVLRGPSSGDFVLQLDDGDRLAVRVDGAGAPLILVHGLGGSLHDWDALVPLLARHFRILRFDARGHGARSGDEASPATLARLAADLAAVVDAAGLRPLLVGHSMGALTVLQLVADRGSAGLAGVCLLDQSPRLVVDADWQLGLFGTLTRDALRRTVERLQRDFAGAVLDELSARCAPRLAALVRDGGWLPRIVRRVLGRVHSRALVALLESLADCDFRATLATLSAPAMVVLGERSQHYRGLPLADWYAGTLPTATLCRYAGSGHSPHRDEPQRLAADLIAFAQGR